MKYTIKKLAELAGISTRTLRYYDQIGLLKPREINKSNYRIYDEKNVNKLQQIMFYRSLDFPLAKIKEIMTDPDFSRLKALKDQRQMLLNKQSEINTLLTNIDLTIKNYSEETKMADTDKFKAFKQQQIDNNENEFGKEIRAKYGEEAVTKSNEKFGDLSEKDYQEMQSLEQQLVNDLVDLKKKPDLDSELAKKVYQEHKKWLGYTWSTYSKESHRGLVEMYLNDDRFSKYYNDKAKTPVVKLLHDVVYHYTK